MKDRLEKENHQYWMKRAPGYSEVNKEELVGEQNQNWSDYLEERISKAFPKKLNEDIKILDVGAGPGFISIILTKLGYSVTSLDFAESMIEQSKINAGALAEKITYIQGDAQNLPFLDESFDVVISRNLTWNLENPDAAYKDWKRVLKENGVLMNFDANWYSYLFDEEKRVAYEKDREDVADNQIKDYNIGDDFDVMEKIATQLPLSNVLRPQWDEKCLSKIGMKDISSDVNVWKKIWSKEERINFSSTPMFLVTSRRYELDEINNGPLN